MQSSNYSTELPIDHQAKIRQLSFWVVMTFDTGLLLKFEDTDAQVTFSQKLIEAMQRSLPRHRYTRVSNASCSDIISHQFASGSWKHPLETVLSVEITNPIESGAIKIKIDDCSISLPVREIVMDIYAQNSGIVYFKVSVPEDVHNDIDLLLNIRDFFSTLNLSPDVYGTTLEEFLNPSIIELQKNFKKAVEEELSTHIIKFPYSEMVERSGKKEGIIYSHTSFVAVMSPEFNSRGNHLKPCLLNNTPYGIRNFACDDTYFAYIEYKDSLFCIPHESYFEQDPEMVDLFFYHKWLKFMYIRQYSWKLYWDMDIFLQKLMNKLIQKQQDRNFVNFHNDAYRITSFLNYISVAVKKHKPSMLTYDAEALHYLKDLDQNWDLDDMIDDCYDKVQQTYKILDDMRSYIDYRNQRRFRISVTLIGLTCASLLVMGIFYWN